MSEQNKDYLDREQFSAEDLPPTLESLEAMAAAEADLDAEADKFDRTMEALMEKEIADRDTAENALDIVDGIIIRTEKVFENSTLNRLSDVELFERSGGDKESLVTPVAVIFRWMGREDNFGKLMAFRDALDEERSDLPYRAR